MVLLGLQDLAFLCHERIHVTVPRDELVTIIALTGKVATQHRKLLAAMTLDEEPLPFLGYICLTGLHGWDPKMGVK